MTRRGVAMVERREPFRAFRIEEKDEEGTGPKLA